MDINVKKYFITILFTIILSFFFNIDVYGSQTIKAEDIYLIPGGETIGIELQTNVIVVDTYNVRNNQKTINPAKDAGIQSGDMILYIDGKKINNIEDIKSELAKYKNIHDRQMNIIIKRNNKLLSKKMYPTRTNNNVISLGIYLRDNIMGIGTLTFIYDDTNFGALGHQIQDKNIPDMQLYKTNGHIKKAEVTSINKSIRGNPGEKRATFDKKSIGTINTNSITGIYGKVDKNSFKNKKKLKIATQDKIQLGHAKILTVINKHKVEAFDVKIIETFKQNQKDIKGIKLKITDERLLNKTGGIIQGMSGSPIIQNNRIIGAVTHVLVDDTTIGYGVYIEFMLEDMGIDIQD
ncbi:SpoIVB peptidase [Mycoplasmatota bacterium]|nr:SpoIVB peptidase [Mycoplasmatota bacterium]